MAINHAFEILGWKLLQGNVRIIHEPNSLWGPKSEQGSSHPCVNPPWLKLKSLYDYHVHFKSK